jgi:nucleoside-diphosphate-sugar epimerase
VPLQKLLITGGSGFLGRLLRARLAGQFEVHSIHRSGPGSQGNSHQLDLRDDDAVRCLILELRPDVVVHAAALSGPAAAETNPRDSIETNIIAASRVAEASCLSGASQVIALSSVKAALPQNTYGLSKALMERCLFRLALERPLTRILGLRLPNILDSPRSFLGDWKRMLETQGTIVTRGYEMSRFACKGDEAVDQIAWLIRARDLLPSGTVIPVNRAIRIKDALFAFTRAHKCDFERSDSRFDTSTEEAAVGLHEAPWTEKIELQGRVLFHSTPGREKASPLVAQVDTTSAEFYSPQDCEETVARLAATQAGNGE